MESSTHFFFAEGFCRSWGVVITMKELSAFLDGKYKNWAHKIASWKYLTIWRPVVPVFPRAKSASFLFCTVNSFQGVLKVTGYSSTYWILVEVDGKCQFVVDIIKIDFTYFFLLCKCKNKFQGHVCGLHYISVGQWCPNVQQGTLPSPAEEQPWVLHAIFPRVSLPGLFSLGFYVGTSIFHLLKSVFKKFWFAPFSPFISLSLP